MILRCDPEDPSFPTPIPEAARPDRLLADQVAQADSSSLPLSINPWAILDRPPLADAVLNLSRFPLHPAALDRIFQAHRGPSSEHLLGFPAFVPRIADARLQHHGSGRQGFQRADEQGRLPTGVEAASGKLRRIPRTLSLGSLEETSADLRALFPETASAWESPACLRGLNLTALDGKALKKAAGRLKATRGALGKIPGGELLVATAPRSGLVLTMAADLDGEADEARLVPDPPPRVKRHVPDHRPRMADRQFGGPVQIERSLARDGDHVPVRRDGRTSFRADPERPTATGRDARGRVVIQEWGRSAAESNPRRRHPRRITLLRPGEEAVVLMTDLLDERRYPADDLLEAYLARWRIERVFRRITEVFAPEHLIGSTARATTFQAASGRVLDDLIQVVRGSIASGRAEVTAAEGPSGERIFCDVRRPLIAVSEPVSAPELTACSDRTWGREALRARPARRLGGVWTERRKEGVNKEPRPKEPAVGSCYGAHNSVHRLVDHHNAKTRPP